MCFIKPTNHDQKKTKNCKSRSAALRTWNMPPQRIALSVPRAEGCI